MKIKDLEYDEDENVSYSCIEPRQLFFLSLDDVCDDNASRGNFTGFELT